MAKNFLEAFEAAFKAAQEGNSPSSPAAKTRGQKDAAFMDGLEEEEEKKKMSAELDKAQGAEWLANNSANPAYASDYRADNSPEEEKKNMSAELDKAQDAEWLANNSTNPAYASDYRAANSPKEAPEQIPHKDSIKSTVAAKKAEVIDSRVAAVLDELDGQQMDMGQRKSDDEAAARFFPVEKEGSKNPAGRLFPNMQDTITTDGGEVVPAEALDTLFRKTHGGPFDKNSSMDRKKMQTIKDMLAEDPNLLKVSPTQFALKVYSRN